MRQDSLAVRPFRQAILAIIEAAADFV